MRPKHGRFYVHGSSPKILVTNEDDQPVLVQIWQTSSDESGEFENTKIYFSLDKEACTLDKGTPMPEGSTILRILLAPGESVYGVSDDQGRGGWLYQQVVV